MLDAHYDHKPGGEGILNVLDLFSGIGGFSLGLERAGMRTVAFCEIEPYCQAVLRKHWPNVPIYEDVRELTGERLEADGITRIDVICGGFPCQDISNAGKREGIEGERSGLWSEFARLIGEIRPRYAIVENVSALLGRGLSRVLGDLTEIGYDAEWNIISARDVGAPHLRERIWIVAFPHGCGCGEQDIFGEQPWRAEAFRSSKSLVDTDRNGSDYEIAHSYMEEKFSANCEQSRCRWTSQDWRYSWWFTEPDVGRVANGVPSRVDRLKSLGNAVVPQIPEIIGKAIMRTL